MTERTHTTKYGIVWTFHHPKVTDYHIGYLGEGLTTDFPSVKDYINSAYPFGGWQPFAGIGQKGTLGKDKSKWFMNHSNHLSYPGDPPMEPIASCKVGEETVCIYRSDWWAIIQPDGSFEVARLD